MEENYLKKMIKKSTGYALIICIACFVLSIIVFWGVKDKISTLFTKLETVSSIESVQKLYDDKKAYIELKDANIYFLDYAIYTYNTVNGIKTGEEKLDQVYGIIEFEDGYLLTLLPKKYLDMTDEELTGVNTIAILNSLEEDDDGYHNDAYDELIKTLSESFETEASLVKDYVPEICVTIPDDGRRGDQISFAISAALLLAGLGILVFHFTIKSNYKSSKFYKSLNKNGNAESIEYALDRSIATGTYLYKGESKSYAYLGLITPEYVLAKNGNSPVLHSTSDMIWAHLKVTKQKSYFVTVSKSYQVAMYFKNVKNPVTLDFTKEDQAIAVVQTLADKLSIIAGYSDELKKMYDKDYQGFVRMAEEQKESASENENNSTSENETYE